MQQGGFRKHSFSDSSQKLFLRKTLFESTSSNRIFFCKMEDLYFCFMVLNSIFSIYFIRFFVTAQNQLFSLSLFFFAHLILGMLGLLYLFFHILQFQRCIHSPFKCLGWLFLQKKVIGFKLLIVFANDFCFDVSLSYEFAFEFF